MGRKGLKGREREKERKQQEEAEGGRGESWRGGDHQRLLLLYSVLAKGKKLSKVVT